MIDPKRTNMLSYFAALCTGLALAGPDYTHDGPRLTRRNAARAKL